MTVGQASMELDRVKAALGWFRDDAADIEITVGYGAQGSGIFINRGDIRDVSRCAGRAITRGAPDYGDDETIVDLHVDLDGVDVYAVCELAQAEQIMREQEGSH